jgi:hypothetical protein
MGSSFSGYAGGSITTGTFNTMLGSDCGYSATTGTGNTFVGASSGNTITTGEKNTILGRYDGNQGGLDIRTSNNNIVISDGDGNPFIYGSSGRDVIFPGATNTYTRGSTETVSIYGNEGERVLQVQNVRNLNGDQAYRSKLGSNADNSSSYHFVFTTGSNDRCYIYGNGNIANTNNSYGVISDQRLKENIVDASSQWDDIKAVTIRNFNLIGNDTTHIGVVAQELEAAGMSGLVENTSDLSNEGETVKTVKMSVLYMKAVKALQEAMTRIETLETKVAALESN